MFVYIYYYPAKSLQSCPTLCDPIDGSPPGSPIPGILQARTLVWVTISFSNARKWKVKVKSLSRVGLLATSWTAAHQAPLSMGFSRQEYWSGCHCLLQLLPYFVLFYIFIIYNVYAVLILKYIIIIYDTYACVYYNIYICIYTTHVCNICIIYEYMCEI